jgi:glycerol uptake facilitator-like aquaporin
MFNNLVVSPTGSEGHLFASEFIGTFILTYIVFTIILEDAEAQKKETKTFKYGMFTIYYYYYYYNYNKYKLLLLLLINLLSLTFYLADGLTVYSTKAKNANAPFVFGFILFGILNIGGVSGMKLNPVSVIIPSLVTGKWKYVWIYLIAEFLGASSASLMVHLQQIKVNETLERNTIVAEDVISEDISPLIE